MKWDWDWSRVALAVVTFYVIGLITNGLHDWLFISHTSIQNGVEVCTNLDDCWTEDNVRAYDSSGWALMGNSFSIVTLAIRSFCALFAFVFLVVHDRGYATSLAFGLPGALSLIAMWPMPYDFYMALRVIIAICCICMIAEFWKPKTKIVPALLAILMVVYNPIFPFHMHRLSWMAWNGVSALVFLALAMLTFRITRKVNRKLARGMSHTSL